MPEPLAIWIISDAKPGHLNQTRALAEAVKRRVDANVHELDASRASRLKGELPSEQTAYLPAPDLILCAGRATHRPARRAKQRFGGRLVVCMRPSSKQSEFDLCLIPRHDDADPAPNVETTAGAIVNVRPSDDHDPDRGVILVGGESKHHAVDAPALASAVEEIVARDSGTNWELTTSRRTPDQLTQRLRALQRPNLTVIPADETPRGWVGERLATAGLAWVSEDSVSMLCEAVTSGCATGVLPMRRKRARSRVYRCADEFTGQLMLAASLDAWRRGEILRPPTHPLDEADRCGRLIVERLIADPGQSS